MTRKPERLAMPRTAPTVNGTGTFKVLSISYIDSSNDKRTDSYQIPAAATDAQVEALVVAIAADSNANIYKVRVADVYNSQPDTGDALNEVRPSLHSNIVILAKTALNDSDNLFIPAPKDDNFVPTTDDILSGALAASLAAYLAIKGAGWEIISGRYTERREVNKSVLL